MDKDNGMDTWHYHAEVVHTDKLLHPDDLNYLGEMGWELIAVHRLDWEAPTWLLVFKKLNPRPARHNHGKA